MKYEKARIGNCIDKADHYFQPIRNGLIKRAVKLQFPDYSAMFWMCCKCDKIKQSS